MKVAYVDKSFRNSSLELIGIINSIIEEYQAQGFVLTVRQLYYQLVARDYIANNLNEYKRIAGLLNDARLAGYVDWDAIEDRTREFIRRASWETGSDILNACAQQFHMDMWEGQESRVFVLVEKEALVGVLERVCHRYDIPLLAARGYPSVSVVREFAVRDLARTLKAGQHAVVLHLGDHDPSGIDMTRDIRDRISLFLGRFAQDVTIKRIALNMSQVEELNPPENPAKTTDARFESYMRKFGTSSWELDALSPKYLEDLVTKHVNKEIDTLEWNNRTEQIDRIKDRIGEVAESFDA